MDICEVFLVQVNHQNEFHECILFRPKYLEGENVNIVEAGGSNDTEVDS